MLLETHAIRKSFGGNLVLKDINLSFCRGQIHALIGENGAGKSTLVKILAGVYFPDSGQVTLEGRQVVWKNPAQAQQAGISLIPQELNLASHLTVAENVFLGIETTRWGFVREELCRRRTAELIQEYHLDFSPDEPVTNLSPSHKQQVEILRALVRAQKVLILDESTAYFSERESAGLYRMMRRLRERDLGLIFITHRLEELEGLADWVTVLRDGECVASTPFAETALPEILSRMVGGQIEQVFPEKPPQRPRAVLSLRNVSLAGFLQNVSFDIHEGEILGLGGFVGSRRTLVAELLFGLHPEYTGEIRLDGQTVRFVDPSRALQMGIAFVTEDRKATGLFPHLSLLDNVALGSLPQFEKLFWIGRVKERTAAEDVIRQLRVRYQHLDQPVTQLSGGNQQKCILARWLLTRPRVLVLDEPTRGIDMGARLELYRWFTRLAAEGLSILLISSDLRELEGLCERIAVFREGELVTILEGKSASRHQVVRYAALGA